LSNEAPTISDSILKNEEEAPHFKRYLNEVDAVIKFNRSGQMEEYLGQAKADKSDQNIGV
jgi:hypothetical protein